MGPRDELIEIFQKLNESIERENQDRIENGMRRISRCEITILGQASLFAQPELTSKLDLVQTGDLDALLKTEHFVKRELKKILAQYRYVYDEDSDKIFIPKGSQFFNFLDLVHLNVKVIDPESALVSKAVKAPEKNKILVRQAIVSRVYPNLISRIKSAGGDLGLFM